MSRSFLKNHSLPQTHLLLGVPLFLILLLLAGGVTLPLPGFPPIRFAHAAKREKIVLRTNVPTSCASAPTAVHCDNQDPIIQGCNKDAVTIAYWEAINDQGELFATVERRYSPTCQSEWGRMIQPVHNHRFLSIQIAKNRTWVTSGPIVFTQMLFVPNLSIAFPIVGSYSIKNIPDQHALEKDLILPALPAR